MHGKAIFHQFYIKNADISTFCKKTFLQLEIESSYEPLEVWKVSSSYHL